METRCGTGEEQPRELPDVRDLDAAGVLDDLVLQQQVVDRAEARRLALAVHWVDLHPVLPDSLDAPGESIAGDGTPPVAEFAVEELGAALDLSIGAVWSLVTDAVELRYRLPRLWDLVQDGSLQAWRARQVARKTQDLSRTAVAWLDTQLAVTGTRNRIPPVNPAVHEARLQCDPDQALAVEETALAKRGVWLDHRESTVITQVTATLDTLDALDLDTTLGDLATLLGRLGDTDPYDVRRATALGMLAHPQRVLDLADSCRAGLESGMHAEAGSGEAMKAAKRTLPERWLNGSRATLYLHLDAHQLLAHAAGSTRSGGTGQGHVEGLGSASVSMPGCNASPPSPSNPSSTDRGRTAMFMRPTIHPRDGGLEGEAPLGVSLLTAAAGASIGSRDQRATVGAATNARSFCPPALALGVAGLGLCDRRGGGQ